MVDNLTEDFYPKSALGVIPIAVTVFREDVIVPDFLVHLICDELECDVETAEVKFNQPRPPKAGFTDYRWVVSLSELHDRAVNDRVQKEKAKKKKDRDEKERERNEREPKEKQNE